MADDWALYEYVWPSCYKVGGLIQISFILVCVSTPKQLISGISQIFAVLSLNCSSQVVLLTCSPAPEAEYFVSAVFLLCAGVEEWIVDS